MIGKRVTGSYPYMTAAWMYCVPYGEVLRCSEALRGPGPYGYPEQVVNAVQYARDMEARRRAESENRLMSDPIVPWKPPEPLVRQLARDLAEIRRPHAQHATLREIKSDLRALVAQLHNGTANMQQAIAKIHEVIAALDAYELGENDGNV